MSQCRIRVVHELPNESYHNDYKDYISSTTLKKYRLSGLHFKEETKEEKGSNPSFALGNLWHDMIASKSKNCNFDWKDHYAIFQPKINDKTKKPYGDDTNEQRNARLEFASQNEGKNIVTQAQFDTASIMADNIFANPDHRSYDFFMKVFNAGIPEVSYFLDNFIDGINIRIRPDLDCGKIIFDYKSFGRSIEEFPRVITDLGYDISAGMYVEAKKQFYRNQGEEEPEVRFYWIVQESNSPYDWAIFSAENFLPCGTQKFYELLDRHKFCKENGIFDGVASLNPDKNGIFKPEPSFWQTKLNNLL